jgi:hypothetical protein
LGLIGTVDGDGIHGVDTEALVVLVIHFMQAVGMVFVMVVSGAAIMVALEDVMGESMGMEDMEFGLMEALAKE